MDIAKVLLWALLMGPMVSASNKCSFQYSVPKSGGSCVPLGGVDEDLENKVYNLNGGLEGIKVIGEANVALTKELYNAISRTKMDQMSASQQLDNLAIEVQNLKLILNVVYDEAVDEGDDDENIERSKRNVPVDPNKLLRDALMEADRKIKNMTSFLTESVRQQSMTRSTMEMRIQQQQMRLQNVMRNVEALERQLFKQKGHPRAASPFYNTANNDYLDLVNTSIETSALIAARIEIAKARYDDIDRDINDVLVPLSHVENDLSKLYADTLKLTKSVKTFEDGIDDLANETSNLSSQWKLRILDILQNYSTLRQKVSEAEKNASDSSNLLASKGKIISDDEKKINAIKTNIDLLAQRVTDSLSKLNKTRLSIDNTEHLPAVILAEAEENAKAEIQRELNVMNQLQSVISSINKLLATIPKPSPSGSHPRRLSPRYKSIICQ